MGAVEAMENNREEEEEHKLSQLPSGLVVDDVLTRLPVRSLARFRCVCKPWLSLLTADHNFAKKQLLQRMERSLALVSSRMQQNGTVSIYAMNFFASSMSMAENNNNNNNNNNNKISFQELGGCSILSNSVNGVVACGYQSVRPRTNPSCCHYLLNPSTREIVPLPPTTTEDNWGMIGFGYASRECCYKLVRLFSAAGSSRIKFCKCEVLTVGDNRCWKYLGEAPAALPCSEPIFLNGAIHWLACKPASADDGIEDIDVIILAFDIEHDKFRLMPVPEQERPSLLGTGELGGQLCVTVLHDHDGSWTIWLLQDYYAKQLEWTKLHVISTAALSGDSRRPMYPNLIGIKNGKVLLQNINDGPHFQPIYIYDPDSCTVSQVLGSGQASTHLHFYTESLVSPRNLLNLHGRREGE